MDRIGTRRGLSLTVAFYSIVSMATALARGFYSFAGFRFLLGAGESGNWPAATKAVSEWFPKRERGLATALFDSRSEEHTSELQSLCVISYAVFCLDRKSVV